MKILAKEKKIKMSNGQLNYCREYNQRGQIQATYLQGTFLKSFEDFFITINVYIKIL